MIGQRQEVRRHQQPAPRMRPPHQRLDAAHRARRDLRLRLVVQDQLRRPRARRAARRAAPAAAASDGRARAGRPRGRSASAWPRTSRRPRAAAARSRRRRARGTARSRSTRRCARESRRPRTSAPAPPAAAATRRDADASSPGSSTTANSSPPSRAQRVAGLQRLLQPRPDLRQHLVAGVMAERVVELLEAVEVDQQQRDLARRRSVDRLLSARQQMRAGSRARSGRR